MWMKDDCGDGNGGGESNRVFVTLADGGVEGDIFGRYRRRKTSIAVVVLVHAKKQTNLPRTYRVKRKLNRAFIRHLAGQYTVLKQMNANLVLVFSYIGRKSVLSQKQYKVHSLECGIAKARNVENKCGLDDLQVTP